ncbi:MAG: lipoyl synthase [Deltaproteobacteria bacterium]|nr:lipoyl synthase [Deltaproteobacteria bacterium]
MHPRIHTRKPPWIRTRLPLGPEFETVQGLLRDLKLSTVCQEALCPNRFECFGEKTATFLILGDRCTRNCRFCAVSHGQPALPDPEEPDRVADAAATLGLDFIVVTSVTRDDLEDGGAAQFAKTITAVKKRIPGARVEVLVPDFSGNRDALATVLAAGPDVLNHNVETVRRLYPKVRPEADYDRSVQLLREAAQKAPEIPIKSGLMLGVGETLEEIRETLKNLHAAGCRILTLGQYLQPSPAHLPVFRFVPPETFQDLKETALKMGFTAVAGGPLVRSSYHARRAFEHATKKAPRSPAKG